MMTRKLGGDPRELSEQQQDDLDEFVTREVLTYGPLSTHNADLSRFKGKDGEFKRWLHIFHVANRPTFRDTYLKVTTVVPWCHPGDEIDIDYHRAVVALNGYAQYPLAWKSFSWTLPPLETSPIYAVFAPNPSQGAMFEVIERATGYHPQHLARGVELEFWDRMKQFILIPRQDGELLPKTLRATQPKQLESIRNAYSGSGEIGPESL